MKTYKTLKQYSESNKYRDVTYENIFRHMLMEVGIKYRRQVVIGHFIVDFVILERGLIIEIDEPHHDFKIEKDLSRQKYLEEIGFTVLRVKSTSNFIDAIETIETYKPHFAKAIRYKGLIHKANRDAHPEVERVIFRKSRGG